MEHRCDVKCPNENLTLTPQFGIKVRVPMEPQNPCVIEHKIALTVVGVYRQFWVRHAPMQWSGHG